MAKSPRRFPSPWRAEPMPGGYIVRDANGQALAYLYSRDNDAEARQARRFGGQAPTGRVRSWPQSGYNQPRKMIPSHTRPRPRRLDTFRQSVFTQPRPVGDIHTRTTSAGVGLSGLQGRGGKAASKKAMAFAAALR
jgi:hypothetical protein